MCSDQGHSQDFRNTEVISEMILVTWIFNVQLYFNYLLLLLPYDQCGSVNAVSKPSVYCSDFYLFIGKKVAKFKQLDSKNTGITS